MPNNTPANPLKPVAFVALMALAASVALPAQALGLGGVLRPKMVSPGAKALNSGQSRLFDFGKNTKPRYAYESARPNGSRSLVYGNQLRPGANARPIDKPHGHSVRDADGKLSYSRTPGGQVLKDTAAP